MSGFVAERYETATTHNGRDEESSHISITRRTEWTPEEDRQLCHLVEAFGDNQWSKVACYLPGRTGKQCRARWQIDIRPDIKRGDWTAEEEESLIRLYMQFGSKWSEIARFLPGRTDNSIKNHWNATTRRLQHASRKINTTLARYIWEELLPFRRQISSSVINCHMNGDEQIQLEEVVDHGNGEGVVDTLDEPGVDYAGVDDVNWLCQHLWLRSCK